MDDLGVPLFLETSISGKHLELQGQPVVGVSHKFFRGRVYSHQNLPWDCFLAEVFFFQDDSGAISVGCVVSSDQDAPCFPLS